jgi:RimJ/RimL family protein N-acetyltransferase
MTNGQRAARPAMRIEPWGSNDRDLVQKLTGDPAMMEHLGGPETDERVADRQRRYEAPDSGVFKILDAVTGQGVGSVGYWEKTWREEQVYEVGWAVLRAFQGRGIAGSAVAQLIDLARSAGDLRFMHAFPSVDNAPSNAICRKLGFALLSDCEFEYPAGSFMRCNDWRLDLFD